MTLEETLIKSGFESKEAKIYLACLELGPSTVLDIAKKAGVKRPTTYVLLDRMATQGFIAKTYRNNKLLYAAEKPDALLRTIRAKEDALRDALPLLHAIMATTKTRPKISIFEGRAGMEQVYTEIYENPEITFFGSIRDVSQHFSHVVEQFQTISKQRKNKVKDLLTHHPIDIAWGKRARSPTYEVRILPKGLDFAIDCAIYGNKVAILAVKRDLFAVVIESEDVANSFRALHALAWQSAVPIEEIAE